MPWPARRGLQPLAVGLLYAGLALAPIGLAATAYPLEARPSVDDIASALGLVAFAVLLVEFLFSGRYRWVSGRIGIDRTMRIHRWVAYATTALILIHPFLYAGPGGSPWPWFSGRDPALGLATGSLAAGVAAWVLVAALVLTAVDRRGLPVRHEIWRAAHTAGALLLGALVAVHAFTAGGYSSTPLLAGFWGLLMTGALASVLLVHVLRPWQQRRAPYVIRTVDRVGANTWCVRLVPRSGRGRHDALRFRPGQFAWLKIGGKVFAAGEHPFSMSTAPEEAPEIGFTIKEKGDFTGRIGELEAGMPAHLDGPHGHFVPDEAEVPTVYVAGGIGIAPVLSHLRAFRSRGDRRPITLVYGCHTAEHIAERAELDALAHVLNLTVHYVVRHAEPGWRGRRGLINRDLLDACLPADQRDRCRYFVCGPEPMMDAVERALRGLGVPRDRIVTGS